MRRPLPRACLVAALLSLVSACSHHVPATVELCRYAQSPPWRLSGTAVQRQVDEVYVGVRIDDARADPMPRTAADRFWIHVQASVYGEHGHVDAPLTFDPSGATLTLNGRVIPAMPGLWRGGRIHGELRPVEERTAPQNLNLQTINDNNWFIAFPVPPPGLGDVYEVSLGSIEFRGRSLKIPGKSSCFTPATTLPFTLPRG